MRRPSWLAGPPHPEGDACVAPTACLWAGLIVCAKMNHRILIGAWIAMSYVDRIVRWSEGSEWRDGSGLRCEPGDYPEVRYDLARIAREVDRDALARGPSSLWRYSDLLPIDEPERAVTLGEGWTPVLPMPRLGEALGCSRLSAKDEGRNPSGTFKDRGASVAVTRLRELGISTVVHNSSGNAGGAWALYAARAGLRCVNLLPPDVMAASLQQSTLSGADTVLFEGPWQESGTAVAKAAEDYGWFNVGTLKEPHRLELRAGTGESGSMRRASTLSRDYGASPGSSEAADRLVQFDSLTTRWSRDRLRAVEEGAEQRAGVCPGLALCPSSKRG